MGTFFISLISVPVSSGVLEIIGISNHGWPIPAGFFFGVIVALIIASAFVGSGCMKCHKDVIKL